jgi:hypothetical protein
MFQAEVVEKLKAYFLKVVHDFKNQRSQRSPLTAQDFKDDVAKYTP